jgi:hypothetical protein
MPEPISLILGGLALLAKKHVAVQAVHAVGAHVGAAHATAANYYYDPTTGMNYIDPSSASQSFNPLDNSMVDDEVEKYVEKRSQKKGGYRSMRSNQRMRCDVCDDGFSETSAHYHCDRCHDGNFDICRGCFDKGYRCRRESHDLRKRRQVDGRWESKYGY